MVWLRIFVFVHVPPSQPVSHVVHSSLLIKRAFLQTSKYTTRASKGCSSSVCSLQHWMKLCGRVFPGARRVRRDGDERLGGMRAAARSRKGSSASYPSQHAGKQGTSRRSIAFLVCAGQGGHEFSAKG